MRINQANLKAPKQAPYQFSDGEVDSDPMALSAYFGNDKASGKRRKPGMYDRQYQKARRLERMARRAEKSALRNHY